MKYLVDTLSLDYHQEAIDYLEHKSLLKEIACNYLQEEKPTLFGVIYASPDDMGHKYGFESDEYYSELELVDQGINAIIKAVDRAGILNQTVFIVSSDHGGNGKSHGGITLAEMETPFIIVGSGIKSGYDYEIEEIMMQYDIASIILDLLRIEQPSFWRGHSLGCIYGESSGLGSVITKDNDQAIIKTEYYDINGIRYDNEPQNKIVIRRDISSEGTAKSSKFLNR